MMLVPSFIVLFAFFFAAGSAIREAGDEEFPFQVSVQTMERHHLCGGAIITPTWVLTASFCLANQPSVRVSYGSADSNNPVFINSHRIQHQTDFNLFKKSRLALIELEKPIQFSKTVKKAKLPTPKAEYQNTTKLSGWKIIQGVDVPPVYNLYVSDVYYVVTKNCKTITGAPVTLDVDEFCGMEEDFQNNLYNLGSIVSKSEVVLGILAEKPVTISQPTIFVKLSEHSQWIKDVLKSDAQYIHWVDDVPKDSAPSLSGMNLVVIGISSVLLTRFF